MITQGAYSGEGLGCVLFTNMEMRSVSTQRIPEAGKRKESPEPPPSVLRLSVIGGGP
jgi:hypothetical protein